VIVVSIVAGVVIGLFVLLLIPALRVVPEYERAVLFRLGHLKGARGPGCCLCSPCSTASFA
jgi:regulator of protease activity HflC (stomatin/prohibitin superfamily)